MTTDNKDLRRFHNDPLIVNEFFSTEVNLKNAKLIGDEVHIKIYDLAEAIRQVPTAPAVDVEGLKLEFYRKFPDYPSEEYDDIETHNVIVSDIFDRLAARGLIGNAQKSDMVAVPREVMEKIAYALDRAAQFKTNDMQRQIEEECLSMLQPYTKGEK